MTRLRQFLDPYIGLMMLTVACAALLPAQGQGARIAGAAADAGIIFLFFLYGARLSLTEARNGFGQWQLQLAILISTFAIFPVLGVGIGAVASFQLPPALVTGLIFLCILPSTVQSSIAFTAIARGNVAAALCAASVSNVIGVFVSPTLAGFILHTQGVQLSFGVFRDVILQLLLPFIVGQTLRPLIGGWVQRHKHILGYADRGSILLIIYVAFSKGMSERIWYRIEGLDLVLLAALLAAMLGLILFLLGVFARRVMRLKAPDAVVLQFCGSNKSLASGLPMASVLFAGSDVGLIILPLMIFHQLQLIVCAVLARHHAGRAAELTSFGGPDKEAGGLAKAGG